MSLRFLFRSTAQGHHQVFSHLASHCEWEDHGQHRLLEIHVASICEVSHLEGYVHLIDTLRKFSEIDIRVVDVEQFVCNWRRKSCWISATRTSANRKIPNEVHQWAVHFERQACEKWITHQVDPWKMHYGLHGQLSWCFGWDITLTDLHQPSGTVSSEVNTNSSISLILDSSYHLFVRNLLELQGTCSWWTALVKDSWLSSSYSVLFVSKHQWTLKPKAPLDIPRFVKSRGWIETFAALVTCIRTAHDAKLRIPCDGHHCSLIFARHMSDCTQRRLTKANKKASSKWGNRHCEYIIAYKKGLRTPIFIFINFFNSSTTAGT